MKIAILLLMAFVFLVLISSIAGLAKDRDYYQEQYHNCIIRQMPPSMLGVGSVFPPMEKIE